MTVAEMLERIDSRELSEWLAYEQVHGPLDDTYTQEALACIQETLQAVIGAIGTINGGEYNMKLVPFRRASQFFEERDDEDNEPKKQKPAQPANNLEQAGNADDLNFYFDLIEGKI